jgi:nicotinamidase/pyrazinamidase
MQLDEDHDALLVVDLQPDFMPGGALAVAGGDLIVEPIARLMASGASVRFRTVVATQDWHSPRHASFASSHPGKQPFDHVVLNGADQTLWPDHCVQGTPGAQLHAGLPRDPLTLVLRKGARPDTDSYSAFRENVGPDGRRAPTGLGAFLLERGVRRVFLVGLARDYCVGWSALDARAAGLEAIVLEDLTRSVAPERGEETTRAFRAAGVASLTSGELER